MYSKHFAQHAFFISLYLDPQVVIFRGLRLKCGLDCGKLQGEINGITGRMSYRWDGSFGPDVLQVGGWEPIRETNSVVFTLLHEAKFHTSQGEVYEPSCQDQHHCRYRTGEADKGQLLEV